MFNTIPQLRRGFNLRFWLTTLATMSPIYATFLQPLLQNLQQSSRFLQGYHDELILKAFSSDVFSAFNPVLAGIPFAAGYQEDVKSKFVRFYLVRCSYHDYLLGSIFGCWLSGSLAILIGSVSAYGLTALVILPLEQVTETPPALGTQIVSQIILLFLNGGLWAVVGMAISTIIESRFIAYASPFILYYLLVILYERYIPDAFLIYPKNWIAPEKWPCGVWGAGIFLMELTILAGTLFYIRGRRRLERS